MRFKTSLSSLNRKCDSSDYGNHRRSIAHWRRPGNHSSSNQDEVPRRMHHLLHSVVPTRSKIKFNPYSYRLIIFQPNLINNTIPSNGKRRRKNCSRCSHLAVRNPRSINFQTGRGIYFHMILIKIHRNQLHTVPSYRKTRDPPIRSILPTNNRSTQS